MTEPNSKVTPMIGEYKPNKEGHKTKQGKMQTEARLTALEQKTDFLLQHCEWDYPALRRMSKIATEKRNREADHSLHPHMKQEADAPALCPPPKIFPANDAAAASQPLPDIEPEDDGILSFYTREPHKWDEIWIE